MRTNLLCTGLRVAIAPGWTSKRRAVAVAALILAFPMSLLGAGPRVVLITSSLLERTVVLENWDENMRLMQAVASSTSVAPGALANRPSYHLALFWGPEWAQYMNEGGRAEDLKPEEANQSARFYPAVGSAPALLVFEDGPGRMANRSRNHDSVRSVDKQGLDLLAKHGIRTRMDAGR